ncbi:DUF3304 domain-containing protein [Glaciimonas soli]|uniref:DUF3304 domain-containing protein n=1 Tax=Glaciimonas soli TaxID=2590999 RepID=A0A843YMP2_9BURK|nr:DUF3304 domain-containing protein [Glaciimonas soli]MQR00190.1 DUF3304 domain-containing protein [Glaciimonas soli]
MRLTYSILFAATLALSACAAPVSNTTQAAIQNPESRVNIPMVPVDIACAAHPGVSYIHSFYVQEPFSQRMAGGLSCGGTGAFGYMLPRQWQPHMKVKVRWNRSIKGVDNWIEKTTTIRRYDTPETLFVHFFANDEVRVLSSSVYSNSKEHPILKSTTVAPPEEE